MTQQFDPGEQPLPGSPGAALALAHYTNTLNVIQQDKAAIAGNYQDSELTLYDLSGGLNKVWGRMFPRYLGVETGDSNRTSVANGIDPSQPGQLALSPLRTAQGVYSGSSDAHTESHCWTMFNNQLIIAAGFGGANFALYNEATTGSPGLTAITYTPGARIACLLRTWVGTTERLIVGKEGAAAEVLSTAFANVATMDTATSSMWGIIRTQAGSGTDLYLIYSGTGNSATIKTLSTASAITAAPTASLSGINGGGCGIGLANIAIAPGNVVSRAAWLIPRVGSTTTMYSTGSNFDPPKADIMHCTTDGLDLQRLITRLPFVSWAIVYDGILYYTDGKRIMMNNGVEHDLGWITEREPNSDFLSLCAGLGVANGSLVAKHVHLSLTGDHSGTYIQHEKYDPRTKTWNPLDSQGALNDVANDTYAGPAIVTTKRSSYPMGAMAFSETSFNLYHIPVTPVTVNDYYVFVPPDGYSQFWLYRRTGSTAGQPFEANGTWDSPALLLPHPLTGYPTVITDITIMGDVAAGGLGGSTLASIQWQQATQGVDATYSYSSNISHKVTSADGLRWGARHKSFGPDQWDSFTRLKLRCTLVRYNTNTDTSPNGLPVRIGMRTFMNGVVSSG